MPVPENVLIVLFDGDCGLCDGVVQFLLKHDPEGTKFRFVPIQSAIADNMVADKQQLLSGEGTLVVIDNSKQWERADAALLIANSLGGLWKTLNIFKILSEGSRNRCYNWVARNRYRFFKRPNSCMLPTITPPELMHGDTTPRKVITDAL